MGVHGGKCSAEEGKRAATACLGNSLFTCVFPACPLPSSPHPEGFWGFRGGPWACRTCSNPTDCGEPEVAWVLLVVVPTA